MAGPAFWRDWFPEGEVLVDGDGFCAGFAGADADGLFDGGDEDLAVPDFAGVGGFDDGFGDGPGIGIVDDDFNFDLGEEIDGVFTTAVNFGVALLAAEPLHLGDGHPLDADLGEGFFYFFQFEWLDDCFNFLHERADLRLMSSKWRAKLLAQPEGRKNRLFYGAAGSNW